jgi:hypothetical protein
MSYNLTPSEREQARKIWDLLQLGSEDLIGLKELEAAPEKIRLAITRAARVNESGVEPEENPFI